MTSPIPAFCVGPVDVVFLAEQTSVCLYAEIHDLDFMFALSTCGCHLSTERHVTSDSAVIPKFCSNSIILRPLHCGLLHNMTCLNTQAKKFLQERSPLYMTARSVLQDLRRHLESLKPLELPPRPLRNDQDRAMVVNWRKYLKWEESNPLDIEDTPVLQSRIGYAYRKCLTQMRFYPELWYVLWLRNIRRCLDVFLCATSGTLRPTFTRPMTRQTTC